MSTEPWKYAINQFLVVTEDDLDLITDILDTHLTRLQAASGLDPRFADAHAETSLLDGQWEAATQFQITADANLSGAVQAFATRMEALTQKPNPDTNSSLETWDLTIKTVAPAGGALYQTLMPNGRAPFTEGSYAQRLSEIAALATRLVQQEGKPTLIALAAQVGTWHSAAAALRQFRETKKPAVTQAGEVRAALRLTFGSRMAKTLSIAFDFWSLDLPQVASLWDVNLLRDAPTSIPAAPATAPAWAPATRTLSLPALTPGGTRPVAWRIGPGGAPEQLAIGELYATSVMIPADITFLPGVFYQLWVTVKNGRGQSAPSPSVSWTAPTV